MLDLRLLNYFLVVAREQNMTRAASQLHISQPALSTQIAELEKQLGVKLFKRTNKSTILTEDGILFRTRAQELIDLSNKIEAEFSSDTGNLSGDVYIGCAESYIMAHFSSLFREIQKEHPDIHFHIYSGEISLILERLDKGLLDIGILLGPQFQDKYEYTSTGMYDRFGLLVPADTELAQKEFITIEELSNLPVLLPQRAVASSQAFAGIDLSRMNVAGSYNLITNATFMVEQGLGYCFTIADLANTNGRNLKFIPLEHELKSEAYIVTKKYSYFPKTTKMVLNRMLESIHL